MRGEGGTAGQSQGQVSGKNGSATRGVRAADFKWSNVKKTRAVEEKVRFAAREAAKKGVIASGAFAF